MSKAPQCPSTIGEKEAGGARAALPRTNASGRELWRGLEELADTPEFRDRLEREFPAFASELKGSSRRDFMRVMGASLALAGVVAVAPGCRRNDFKILPYTRDPEDVIHGKALFYATAMPLPGGGCEGLLAETHEGRPTKVEGNPMHPLNRGKSSVLAQASVLDLYDPDRITGVTKLAGAKRDRSTWAAFETFAGAHFAKFDANKGAGLAFLVDKLTSPSREAMRDRLLKKWPQAKWLAYETIDDEAALEGTRLAFGSPRGEILNVAKAKVIVAIDREFLAGSGEGSSLSDARGFASGRRVLQTKGPKGEMNRLYSVESMMTLTGGMADHRLRLKPSQIGAYFAALGAAVASKLGGPASMLSGSLGDTHGVAAELKISQEWIDAVADDLIAHKGESLIVVGAGQPAAAHALACALNSALGNLGKTVDYTPLTGDAGVSSLESITALATALGTLDTLVVIGANPVYTAPADLDFAKKFERVKTTICIGLHEDETASASTWRLPRAHYLESWGDLRGADGTLSVVQPMIAPLAYQTGDVEGARGDLELLALIMGEEKRDAYEIVRQTWRTALKVSDTDFEKQWRRTLHDGVLASSITDAKARGAATEVAMGGIAAGLAGLRATSAGGAGMEVIFRTSPSLHDGRFANNGWLQELPDTTTKITWDNPALISPATAEKLGVKDGQKVAVTLGGRTLQIPVWRQPGLSDDTIALELGYGRTRSGRIGTGVGFNTYELRSSSGMRRAAGATVAPGGEMCEIACVQTHAAMEGRPIILEADLPAWTAYGDEKESITDAYGRPKELNFADRLPPGEAAETPANVDIYKNLAGKSQAHEYTKGPQWGMSIDLTTCVGCAACTTACQAENNIPVVGKSQVMIGREMHWIRVDRYYATPGPEGTETPFTGKFGTAGPYTGGRSLEAPDMLLMPVPCMHCENAPCETVCPVNATVHGDEGLNEMAYNRCIGTRYCSNNCPYKVRRFNFFDYATKRLHGAFIGQEALGGIVKNEQYVPPRLREKIGAGAGEAQTMQYNPDVTVRERGIMEKCTYCVQRINESRVDVKLQGLDHIPDGFFETACQQACPTDAIVFGDILDPLSKVRGMRDNARTYSLLSFLNTRPRTTFMTRMRNPNKRLRDPVLNPFHHESGQDAGHSEHATHAAAEIKDKGHLMSLPVLPSRRAAAAKAIGAVISMGGVA